MNEQEKYEIIKKLVETRRRILMRPQLYSSPSP